MFEQIIPIEAVTDFNGSPLFDLFPFWRRHKVLPFIPVGHHVEGSYQISCVQLLWLRILDSLRQLNYPLTYMKEVCEYFFKDPHINDLPLQILSHNKQQLELKKQDSELDEYEAYILQYVTSLLESKQARLFMYFDRNYLSELVIECITVKQDAGILLYPNGNILEHVGNFTFNRRGVVNFDTTAPYIYLSMKHFLKEFLTSEQLEHIIMPHTLNIDELNIIEELRNDNIQELTIKKNGKDIVRIDSINGGFISGEQAKQIKRILGLKNYEEIQFSTRDEKTLSFKRKRKNYLNKQ